MSLMDYIAVLNNGGVIACPTETLVGLLADARQHKAVDRVIAIKGRGPNEPIALLIPDLASVERWIQPFTAQALALAERYWPGPLTLVVRTREVIHPALVKDGKVGIRIPGASPALDVVNAFGGPLTATSANLSGHSAVGATKTLDPAVRSAVDAVVEGDSASSQPSTVVDVSGAVPVVLRQGAIVL